MATKDEKEKEPVSDTAADQVVGDHSDETLWVVSNRKDDRIVLWERNPAHPGGEAFVGGGTPEHVARTAEIDRLLHEGLILEVAEPPGSTDPDAENFNRKKPHDLPSVETGAVAAQPGQAIPLGRELDPDLVSAATMKKVKAQQARLPQQLGPPRGAFTPEAPGPEKTRTAR